MAVIAASILVAVMVVVLAWLFLAEPLGINDAFRRFRRGLRRRRPI